jgi:hypothetical protein
MEKQCIYAGVSIPKGKDTYVFRTATGKKRIKQLIMLDDVKIDIVDLPQPMTKVEAAQYLKSINFANGDQAIQTALNKVTNAYHSRANPPKKYLSEC